MTSSSKKIVIISVVGLAALSLGAWAIFGRSSTKLETETIQRGDVVENVSVTGSIKPQEKITLQAEVTGRVTKLPFVEGATVKAGDILLELDSRDIQARIASQRAVVDGAAVQLRQLQAGSTTEEIAVTEAAVASAQAKVDAAVTAETDARAAVATSQDNLDTVKAKASIAAIGSRQDLASAYATAAADANDAVNRQTAPLFITDDSLSFTANNFEAESQAKQGRVASKAAQQRISATSVGLSGASSSTELLAPYNSIRADLETIKNYVESCSTLLNFTIGVSSSALAQYRLDVDSALTALNAALSGITSAGTSLSLAERSSEVTAAQSALINSQTNLNAATTTVATARAALTQAQAELTLKKAGTRKETVDAQRAQLAGAQATLASLYAELAKRTLLAPLDGTVTLVDARLGETVQPGKTIVGMNSVGAFAIEVNISEVDVAKVKVGDPVAITLDAFPGEPAMLGHVSTINPGEKVVDGIIFYETTVVFDHEDPRLKSGMTANLDIETARATNVLRVPLRAVKEQAGQKYVDLQVGKTSLQKNITLGLEETEYAEVKSGLNDGDVIIISSTSN